VKLPAVFLDRDGTINVEKNYVYRLSDWEWLPGVIEGIGRLNRAGFKVIAVSNQSGIARGYYTMRDVDELHHEINQELNRHGARIDAFYCCPHHPEFGSTGKCRCRKPAPGLILDSARDMHVDLASSYLVGDKWTDIQAALATGVVPILVATGYGASERRLVPEQVECTDDFLGAVSYITSRSQSARRQSPGLTE
jgi:D-glycero-D-manno-heptose 1,7-bisphosphate phosphatase